MCISIVGARPHAFIFESGRVTNKTVSTVYCSKLKDRFVIDRRQTLWGLLSWWRPL